MQNNYKLWEKFVAYLQMLVHLIFKILLQNFERAKVKVTQSCPAVCDLMDYIVHGILQARIL